MARSIRRIITVAGIGCCLIAAPAWADQLRMECRMTSPIAEYTFSFDTVSGSLTVTPSVGGDIGKWILILAQGGHAVFYSIAVDTVADEVAGRVRILSLNFEKPNMFIYWMGGEMGEPVVSQGVRNIGPPTVTA
jgi:hypothetical protein